MIAMEKWRKSQLTANINIVSDRAAFKAEARTEPNVYLKTHVS